MQKQFAVYLMASRRNGTLYAGVTANLAERALAHREKRGAAFTRRHGVSRLVWYELHDTADAAITREKQIKRWKRAWKLRLIEERNPDWRDLFDELSQ